MVRPAADGSSRPRPAVIPSPCRWRSSWRASPPPATPAPPPTSPSSPSHRPFPSIQARPSPRSGPSSDVSRRAGLVEDPSGRAHLLDGHDLRLLDHLTERKEARSLAEGLPGGDAHDRFRRLGRMLAIGAIRHGVDDTPTPRYGPTAEGATPPDAAAARPPGPAGRIPVYAIWPHDVGPLLSLGMLTAAARATTAATSRRPTRSAAPRPPTPSSPTSPVARGPAVLLCSDYVWSLDANLATARRSLQINPGLLVIHGGPSSPKYPDDATTFLDTHRDVAHVLAHGEGEHLVGPKCSPPSPRASPPPRPTLAAAPRHPHRHHRATYTHPTTRHTIGTPDRPRITDLDTPHLPYLTGEFDHIPTRMRGGTGCRGDQPRLPLRLHVLRLGAPRPSRASASSTVDRVAAEIDWAWPTASTAIITDANFGIMSRDVEPARAIAEVRRRQAGRAGGGVTGQEHRSKHLRQIMDDLRGAEIVPTMSISLQTTDPDTLGAWTAPTSPPSTTSSWPPTTGGGAIPWWATCSSAARPDLRQRTGGTSSSSSTTRSSPAPGRSRCCRTPP